LRTLERFIGRGIVRKRAEGFDYKAQPPPAPPGQGGGGRGDGQYRGRHGVEAITAVAEIAGSRARGLCRTAERWW